MATISNTKYVTVCKNGIFVGGKPAIYYCGQKILYPETIMDKFEQTQLKYPNIKEFRFLASETTGDRTLESGTPVAKHGLNGWACFKFIDGFISPWVLMSKQNHLSTMHYVAGRGALDCLNNFCYNSDVFLQPVLGPYRDVFIQVNLQNTTESWAVINGYRIKLTIEKINQQGR